LGEFLLSLKRFAKVGEKSISYFQSNINRINHFLSASL